MGKIIRSRLILTIIFLFIAVFAFSQQEQEILSIALQSFKKELPNLENQAFKELRKLDKTRVKPRNSEFDNYNFIIIPIFKLKEDFVHYHAGELFVKYIDFRKMWNHFDAFVFKDTICMGSLLFGDIGDSFSSSIDTNYFNLRRFNNYFNFVRQIKKFKPDLVFYPDCSIALCFIKGEKLYIGKWPNEIQTSGDILPFDDFIKKNPSFIKELQSNKNPELKHYKILK
jgi:hypothetical protein